VILSDDSVLVLDAGSGIRDLGAACANVDRIHILLTHLHLDHIQGLLFFAPFFRSEAEIVIWGPPAPGRSLRDRIGRYLSAPLSPVEIRSLPAKVSFRECPAEEWDIGPARVQAASVRHRGPTLGFRITEADASLCYLPDHEPALGVPLSDVEPSWISGFALAERCSLLLHDSQYTDEEYSERVGWGHSRMSDALLFARRSEAEVPAEMLQRIDLEGYTVMADKGFSGEEFEHLMANLGARFLPARSYHPACRSRVSGRATN